MDRRKFIEGLKDFERQLIELVERIDATRDKLLPLRASQTGNTEGDNTLATALHNDIMQLRELCQKFILTNALFMGNETRDRL